MDPALLPFFEKLKDLYTEESFAARVREVGDSFGGLLDAEAVGLFLLDEHGRNAGSVVTLADCRGRAEATVDVTVRRILPAREFARGDGRGLVANVEVADATGAAHLAFWDADVDRTRDGTFREGDRLRVVNARVKDSRYGLELHVGPWTRLEVEGAMDPARRKLMTDTLPDAASGTGSGTGGEAQAGAGAGGAVTVLGTLVVLDATRPVRVGGATRFSATMEVLTGEGRRVVTLWDEAVREARKVPAGATVEITGLARKGNELHTTAASQVRTA